MCVLCDKAAKLKKLLLKNIGFISKHFLSERLLEVTGISILIKWPFLASK